MEIGDNIFAAGSSPGTIYIATRSDPYSLTLFNIFFKQAQIYLTLLRYSGTLVINNNNQESFFPDGVGSAEYAARVILDDSMFVPPCILHKRILNHFILLNFPNCF